jgi:hypothetical protein
MGCFQIGDLDPRLVQDPFMPMDKMKVAMHAKTALTIFSAAKPRRTFGLAHR